VSPAPRRVQGRTPASAGRPPSGAPAPIAEAVWAALHEVTDPELPISIVDMGLVYGVRVDAHGHVEVELTFTATACPCVEFIETDVRERCLRVPGVRAVSVRRVWDPPWTKARISERGRARLRAFGIAL
jgi:metal-sulfur cluster biosynthetic enzyme